MDQYEPQTIELDREALPEEKGLLSDQIRLSLAVAAPFLSVAAIPHPIRRIAGLPASAKVQSATLRILFGSIVLIGSLKI